MIGCLFTIIFTYGRNKARIRASALPIPARTVPTGLSVANHIGHYFVNDGRIGNGRLLRGVVEIYPARRGGTVLLTPHSSY